MEDVNPMWPPPDADAIPLPRVALHFPLTPDAPLTWRARSDAELRIGRAQVRLIRSSSVDDLWLQPGDTVHVRQGERIWLSTRGPHPAEATLTTPYAQPSHTLVRWLVRLRDTLADLAAPRPR